MLQMQDPLRSDTGMHGVRFRSLRVRLLERIRVCFYIFFFQNTLWAVIIPTFQMNRKLETPYHIDEHTNSGFTQMGQTSPCHSCVNKLICLFFIRLRHLVDSFLIVICFNVCFKGNKVLPLYIISRKDDIKKDEIKKSAYKHSCSMCPGKFSSSSISNEPL